MFADPDEKDAGKLKKTASSTLEELDSVKEMVQKSDIKHKDDFAFKLSDMASKEQVCADINRYVCVHIPVVINQSVQTAEVYIFKRNKHGKKIDKENTVISLGLNMSNMGRVEALIQIDKKDIRLNFKLENEKAASVCKENTKGLYARFNEIGYRLIDTKVTQLTDKTTVLNAEEELVKAANKPSVFIDYKI